MTGALDLLAFLALRLPVLGAAAALLIAAARRWRGRRVTGVLLAAAGGMLAASAAVFMPVPGTGAGAWGGPSPLGGVALEAAGVSWRGSDSFGVREPLLHYASWLLLAIAAACGLLAALPAPRRVERPGAAVEPAGESGPAPAGDA